MHTQQLREWIDIIETGHSYSQTANNGHNDRRNMISLQELMEDETHNQLSEDATAIAELRMVTKDIAKFLYNMPPRNTTIKYDEIVKSQNKPVPTITDPALKEILNELNFLYTSPRLPAQQGKHAVYMGHKLIWLNRDSLTTEQLIASGLIHELRHALDNFKSNFSGKYMDQNTLRFNLIQRPSYDEYLKLSHEVNARFAQVLLDIADDPNITRSNLKDKLREYFTKHHITLQILNAENDPKYKKANDRYKKLYSKAASFWQAYEKIKATQPQTDMDIPEIPKAASVSIAKKPGFIQRVKDFATKAVASIFSE